MAKDKTLSEPFCPKIVVFVARGIVVDVYSNAPVEVEVVDENLEDGEVFVDIGNGDRGHAYSNETLIVDKPLVEKVFADIHQQRSRNDGREN